MKGQRVPGKAVKKGGNRISPDSDGSINSRPGEDLLEFLCDAVAFLRNKERVFGSELAEQAGISIVWLSNLENRKIKSKVTLPIFQKLADVLGYDMKISFVKRVQ